MKIGIFIEPSNHFNKEIIRWKKIIKKSFGYQKYLTHPPHLTLAVYQLYKKPNFLFYKSLKKDISLSKKFTIIISKASIFFNDKLTNGNTLHFSIIKNRKILNLQRKIILNFKKIKKNIVIKYKFNNKKFNENYRIYGFPFVGSVWKPHFTISSISLYENKNKTRKVLGDFLSQKIYNKKILVKKISIWKINKDKHKKIYSFNLK